MNALSFIFLHCGDQIVGCILFLILGLIAITALPIGLIVFVIHLVSKKSDKKTEKDDK